MKKVFRYSFIFIIFAAMLAIIPAVYTRGAAKADGAEKRIIVDDCDYVTNWYYEYTAMDDTNYLFGRSSVTVCSAYPNTKLRIKTFPKEANGKTFIENGGIAFADAWFDCFLYVDNADKLSRSGFMKLSAVYERDYVIQGHSEETASEADSFIFFMSNLKLQSGWNYIALKLADAYFTGDYSKREQVYFNLQKFTFVDRANNNPGISYNSANPTASMYLVTMNVDMVTLTDTPRTVTPEMLIPKSVPRGSNTYYTNGVYYEKPKAISAYYTAAYALFGAAAVAAAVTVAFLFVPRRKKKAVAAALIALFAVSAAGLGLGTRTVAAADAAAGVDISCDFAYDTNADIDTAVKKEGYASYAATGQWQDWLVWAGGYFANIVMTANAPKDTSLTTANAAITGYVWIGGKSGLADWSETLNIKLSAYYNGNPIVGGDPDVSKTVTYRLNKSTLNENSWTFFALPLSSFTQKNAQQPFVLPELKFVSMGLGANMPDYTIRLDAIRFVNKGVAADMTEPGLPGGRQPYPVSDTPSAGGSVRVTHGEAFIPDYTAAPVTGKTAPDYPYSGAYAASVAVLAVSAAVFAAACAFPVVTVVRRRKKQGKKTEPLKND